MSRFSSAVTQSLEELEWTQTKLSEATEISFSMLNRYVRGRVAPGKEVVERIAKSLPVPQRATVICAYLEDIMPESGRGIVEVRAISKSLRKTPASKPFFPPSLSARLAALGLTAQENPDVADLVALLAKLISKYDH